MGSSKLTIRGLQEEEEEDTPSLRCEYIDILGAYLDSETSTDAHDAAKAIDNLCPLKKDAADVSSTEDFVWTFWDVLVRLASYIPHDHEFQDRLIEVIQALQELPSITVNFWGNESRLWTDLPLLGPVLRDSWTSPKQDDELRQNKYIDMNAFCARLFGAGVVPWKPNFAIWALRDALESDQLEPSSCYLAAALCWIEHAGRFLYGFMRNGERDDQFVKITAPGDLYKGPGGLPAERWSFWRSRLDSLAGDSGLNELKGRAGAAAKTMASIESGE